MYDDPFFFQAMEDAGVPLNRTAKMCLEGAKAAGKVLTRDDTIHGYTIYRRKGTDDFTATAIGNGLNDEAAPIKAAFAKFLDDAGILWKLQERNDAFGSIDHRYAFTMPPEVRDRFFEPTLDDSVGDGEGYAYTAWKPKGWTPVYPYASRFRHNRPEDLNPTGFVPPGSVRIVDDGWRDVA